MPDTTLPRPIEPGEIRKDDQLRAELEIGAIEGRALSGVRPGFIVLQMTGDRSDMVHLSEVMSWTLLARPTPAPAVGSRWRDPNMNDAEYVRTAMESYRGYTLEALSVLMQPENADIIARLTPIPDHGDGCSPWLWDKETRTAWVAGIGDKGITHVQVAGAITSNGCLSRLDNRDRAIAQRLVSWSERGQANG